MPTKNEPFRTKIDDLVPKQSSVIEKVKPHRARILFWKFLSKMVRCARFFCFSYGSSGACPQKMSHFGLKLTIWWPKQSSVIEKVKPHRARILFWKLVKTCPKWFSSGAVPDFFVLKS